MSTKHKRGEKDKKRKDAAKKGGTKNKKPKRADGPKKKARVKSASSDLLKNRRCPCCKKTCPLTKPKCSKGKAIRKKVLQRASA